MSAWLSSTLVGPGGGSPGKRFSLLAPNLSQFGGVEVAWSLETRPQHDANAWIFGSDREILPGDAVMGVEHAGLAIGDRPGGRVTIAR